MNDKMHQSREGSLSQIGILVIVDDVKHPGYWMAEASGVLSPVVERYLQGNQPLTDEEIGIMRAYLRQWINADAWQGGEAVEQLRSMVDLIRTREHVDTWIDIAVEYGMDPL